MADEEIELMEEVFPIPEALTQTPWEIVGGETPRVMAVAGKLIVPLSPDQHDQVLRTHELAHIKWSPKEIPKDLNPAILAMVEDARITGRMRKAGVNLEPGYPEELVAYTIAKLRATKDRWGAFMFRVGMSGMPGVKVVDEALGKEVGITDEMHSLLMGLRYQAMEAGQSFSWTVAWTRKLMGQIQQEKEEKQQKEQEQRQDAMRRGAAEKAAKDDFEKSAQRQAMEDFRQAEQHAEQTGQRRPFSPSSLDYTPTGKPHNHWWQNAEVLQPWGEMRVEEPPLTQRMPGRFGRQRRPSDTGSALNYPARLWQDQKVFGRKLRGRGGSVLIDGSGSMSLTAEQIWKILENAPGATIAIYSSERSTCARGVLRILAKKGLVVKEKYACSSGGGNVVDFPALEWLAKQDEPRVWVSDGHVTGRNEQSSFANQAQCFDLCRRKRVLRAPHLPQAIKLFEQIRARRAGIKSAGYILGK